MIFGDIMYTRNPGKDAVLFIKAFVSNQLAKFAPKLYVDITRQTGRGKKEEPHQASAYFIECFQDFIQQLGFEVGEAKKFLEGKKILEYGPGDTLGVALLLYAHGAEAVHCVDRFPLSKMSSTNVEVYKQLLESLDTECRMRADNAFIEKGNPSSGFDTGAIAYQVTKNGLSGAIGEYDLIISRSVLEHVNNLEETMLDIKRSMKDKGIAIHKVDLKSHGLDRYTSFDFLTWPTPVYKLMYSHKGFPNRWRVNRYKEFAEKSKLHMKKLTPTGQLDRDKLDIVFSKLAGEFRDISADELSWLGFWMFLEHPNSR